MILIFQSWNFCNNLQYSWSSAMRDKKATECLYTNLIICNSWTYGRIRWKFWPDSPSYIVMDFLDLSVDQFGASIFPPASSHAFELLKICSFNPPPPPGHNCLQIPHTRDLRVNFFLRGKISDRDSIRSPSFKTCTFCSGPFTRKSELFTFKHLKNVCFAGETWHFRFLFLTPVRQGLNSSPPGTCDSQILRVYPGGRWSFELTGAWHCNGLP